MVASYSWVGLASSQQPAAAASTGWTAAGSSPSNLIISLPSNRLLRFPQEWTVTTCKWRATVGSVRLKGLAAGERVGVDSFYSALLQLG